jgi:hypothetical protein
LGKIGELIQLIKIVLNGMNINVNGWKKMRIFKKKKKKNRSIPSPMIFGQDYKKEEGLSRDLVNVGNYVYLYLF